METGSGLADPVSQIVSYLLSFGLPGVCILALGYAYYKKDQRVNDLQDKIIGLVESTTRTLEANTSSISRLADNLPRNRRTTD